jgi:4-hydroxy-tetrahydrodipicolinate reductase
MHAIRMGSLAGDHTVYFCNDYESVSITHHAESRDVFVAGALRAAKWIVRQKPGYYTMQEMLFGK